MSLMQRVSVPEDFVPQTADDLRMCLSDPMWRLCSGYLYKIMVKGQDGLDGHVLPFRPNRAQRKLIRSLHYRNVCLKARQLGFTTLIAIMWLDHALFVPDQRVGIIAHSLEDAAAIFRDKVKFAYLNLPPPLRDAMPLARDSAKEIVFAHNNSAVRVATSMRSGTIHRLHISEMGKIAAKYPEKAREIVTGSLPAVPLNGIAIIESTAEGQEGEFYDIARRAEALDESGRPLNPTEWKFHFFPWWQEPQYSLPPAQVASVSISPTEHEYFDRIEHDMGCVLTLGQRAWYIAKRDNDFSGDAEKMWQEMPSCVVGSTRVSTPKGMVRIDQIIPDGEAITRFLDQGEKPVFEVTTTRGFTVTCTDDHPIKLPDGSFRALSDGLGVGDVIQLAQPSLGADIQTVSIPSFGFMQSEVKITPDFAEFIGIYLGDGCFSHDTIGISCDAQDEDTISAVTEMVRKFIGTPRPRCIGSKAGGIEIRASSKSLKGPFLALDLIEPRAANGGMKRKLQVPQYIMQSPPSVVAAFIRGLFEADGSVRESGASIRFFSKDKQFAEDIQLLLAGLGIISTRKVVVRKVGDKVFGGNTVELGSEATRIFVEKVGFISARKNARAMKSKARAAYNRKHPGLEDAIASVSYKGVQRVYDITTSTSEFSAGAIVVHNCPDECWQKSTEGTFYAVQLARARTEGRICRVPHVQNVPVNTFWDIGSGDGTGIWLHQLVGPQDRFLRYVEGWGEPYAHYVRILRETGFVFGTHYLPHDAEQERQLAYTIGKPIDMLRQLAPDWTFVTVPRIQTLQHGIELTRTKFQQAWFDEEGCKEGLDHLTLYRKTWNARVGAWTDTPEKHTGHSEAADAFRQWAQGFDHRHASIGKSAGKARRRSGFTA